MFQKSVIDRLSHTTAPWPSPRASSLCDVARSSVAAGVDAVHLAHAPVIFADRVPTIESLALHDCHVSFTATRLQETVSQLRFHNSVSSR